MVSVGPKVSTAVITLLSAPTSRPSVTPTTWTGSAAGAGAVVSAGGGGASFLERLQAVPPRPASTTSTAIEVAALIPGSSGSIQAG